MSADRVTQALSRIDDALARIEQAAARPLPDHDTAERLSTLSRKHQELTGEVRAAIGDLDALLGEHAR